MKYEVDSTRWKKKSLFIFIGIFLFVCLFYIFLESNQVKVDAVLSVFQNETSNRGIGVEKLSKDTLYSDTKSTGQRRKLWARLYPNTNISFGLKTPIQTSIFHFQEDGQMTHFNDRDGNTKYAVDKFLIKRLTSDLKYKLKNVLPEDNLTIHRTCVEKESVDNSCDKEGCLQLQLPKSAKARIKQVVGQPSLRVSGEYKKSLENMGDSVPGYYNIILTTAASRNHYEESKALIMNLHKNVFPYLKNFTLVYYDIGLSEWQREDISKICQCHLRTFPFSEFPKIFTRLKCYAWKPMIVYAHKSHCDLLFWMDASIRFYENQSKLKELLELAAVRGLQTGTARNKTPLVTLKSMFHFFGDEPCAYHHYSQCLSGVVIVNNEPLIHEAVIEPWAACALNESCMCPYKEFDLKEAGRCYHGNRTFLSDKFEYAKCHRFDQSALSIIIRKVFLEKSHHIMQRRIRRFLSIKRGDKWEGDSSSFLI